MSETEILPALRLKIGAPANPFEQTGLSPAKALRIAFERAAEKSAEMEASIVGFTETRQTLVQVSQGIQGPNLINTIKGPGGAIGLAIWDMSAVSAFLEQLITGRIVPAQAETRAPTPTDAAVMVNILNLILGGFNTEMAAVPEAPPVIGFRQSGLLEDGRAVAMALEDIAYRVYELGLDMGNGAKKGQLRLVFPWDSATPQAGQGMGGSEWDKAWPQTIGGTQAAIQAILYRKSMSLNDITELQVGTLIPIPTEAIAAISLEGSDHRAVAMGRLGQSNGHRAIRVAFAVKAAVENQELPSFQDVQPSTNIQALAQAQVPAVVPAQVQLPVQVPTATAGGNGAGVAPEDTYGVAVS